MAKFFPMLDASLRLSRQSECTNNVYY